MKRVDPSKGFFLCFLANMALHFWWGIAALILVILHFWLDIPWFLSWLVCVIWGVHALILTALIYWGNRSSQEPDPIRPNKNPYSAKNEDCFPGSGRQEPSLHTSDEQEP